MVEPVETEDERWKKNPLNLLYVQPYFCARAIKMGYALKSLNHGHRITAAGFHIARDRYIDWGDDAFDLSIRIGVPGSEGSNITSAVLHSLVKDKRFDAVHHHNSPDGLVEYLVQNAIPPVIQDTHDLQTFLIDVGQNIRIRQLEVTALNLSDGQIFVTEKQWKDAEEAHLMQMSNPLVLYSYATETCKPKMWLPKLSDKDGQVHLVYEGGLSFDAKKLMYRYIWDAFLNLCESGCHVHCHSAHKMDDKLAEQIPVKHENFHMHQLMSPRDLATALTQYDAGLALFSREFQFCHHALPNKVFECIYSGLPVITSHHKFMRDWVKDNKVGFEIDMDHPTGVSLEKIKGYVPTVMEKREDWTMERHIHRLESYYYDTIEKAGTEDLGI